MTEPVKTVDSLRARVTEKGPWFVVPAGTVESDCARCDADYLYWIRTANGAKMLVDCAVPNGIIPVLYESKGPDDLPSVLQDGRGVAHFATCPNADSFRRRRR